jgi:hypothetical protein
LLIVYETALGAKPVVMVNVAVPLPYAFVAVTVYVVADTAALGVPVIAPVLVFRLNPAGKIGEIE